MDVYFDINVYFFLSPTSYRLILIVGLSNGKMEVKRFIFKSRFHVTLKNNVFTLIFFGNKRKVACNKLFKENLKYCMIKY